MELKIVATREGRLSSFLLGELKMSSSLDLFPPLGARNQCPLKRQQKWVLKRW